jgi:hypothetical protein
VLRTPFRELFDADVPILQAAIAPRRRRPAGRALRTEIMGAVREGRAHELTPFTGQPTGLIHDVRPAGDIVRELSAEGARSLEQALAPRGRGAG